MAGVGRHGRPRRGGWSHSPPVGEGGDVTLFCVLLVCMEVGRRVVSERVISVVLVLRWAFGWYGRVGVGCGGVGVVEGYCCDVIVVYSLVNFFGRNVGRDIS